MDAQAVADFKAELRVYKKYVNQVGQLEDLIGALWQSQGGYKSPKIMGIRVNSPKNMDKYYEISDQIEDLEEEKRSIKKRIDYMIKILASMPIEYRSVCIDVYVEKRKSMESIAMQMYCAKSTLAKRIDKEIDTALKANPFTKFV